MGSIAEPNIRSDPILKTANKINPLASAKYLVSLIWLVVVTLAVYHNWHFLQNTFELLFEGPSTVFTFKVPLVSHLPQTQR